MDSFTLFSSPFWINLFILVPVVLFVYLRRNKLNLSFKDLVIPAIFGAAFGVIEASCVIYLRGALGFLPGYLGTLSDIQRQSVGFYNQQIAIQKISPSLLTLEIIREAGTMIMLVTVAILAAKYLKERIVIFLFTFSIWDIFYYIHLYLTVRWPESLTTPDVLFMIPTPWLGQVWYPLLVSSSIVLIIIYFSKNKKS